MASRIPRRAYAALFVLAACGPTTDADSGVDGVDWAPPPPEPRIDVDGLDAAIEAVFRENGVNPLGVYGWYMGIVDDLTATGGEDCPAGLVDSEYDEGASTTFWKGDCAGERYIVAGGWLSTLWDLEADGLTGWRFNFLFSMRGRHVGTGEPVYAGGKLEGEFYEDGAGVRFDLALRGTFEDGLEPGGLRDGASVGLVWTGAWSPEDGVNGTFDGSIGGAEAGLDLEGITVDPACGPGAKGTVWIRDPGGGWWTIELPDCGGCGTARFAGEEVGETCAGLVIAEQLDASFAAARE